MSVSDHELSGLASSYDIIAIGMAADEVRRARHGVRTTFVRVAEVSAVTGAPATGPATAGEIRVTGVPASTADAIARVREVCASAGSVPVSAFSLSDLEQLAGRENATLRSILEELRGVGLELVAEAPIDLLQDARRSIEEVNIAGLGLARLTVHRTPAADPLPLLKSAADLQHAVAVIRAFAPLPRRLNPSLPTTGYDDVKRVALARIVCDNVRSIQVDWALYGPKLAQVALTVGADDVDAVSPLDDAAGGRRRSPLEEIRRNITAAGFEPVERNGRNDLIAAVAPQRA